MKLPCLLQFRILKLAIKSLLSRPFTTKFPFAPYEPIKEFRGRPRYSEEDCMGCGACAEVCPSKCIDVSDDISANPPARSLLQHLDACICCGQCERYCPTEKGIKLTNEYDFVGFAPEDFEEKVEKELVLCECCGDIIAPLDQLRWLAKRLGALAFANPTVMLVSQTQLTVVDEGVETDPKQDQRSQRVSIQCPKCRRKTSVVM
ncbi:4Fe-4S dicluster domain-containing protein [Verrucomicrobiota bacterium]